MELMSIESEYYNICCQGCLSRDNLQPMISTNTKEQHREDEIYGEMLLSCFSIRIGSDSANNEKDFFMCNECILKLKDAFCFKLQIEYAQAVLQQISELQILNEKDVKTVFLAESVNTYNEDSDDEHLMCKDSTKANKKRIKINDVEENDISPRSTKKNKTGSHLTSILPESELQCSEMKSAVFSEDYSSDNNHGTNCENNNINKKPRGKARNWIKIKEFEEASEAELYVSNEEFWKKVSKKNTLDGEKVQFRCRYGKYRKKECPSAVYLLYHSFDKKVSLYSTDNEHVHDTPPRGLNHKMKEVIIDLFKNGVRKPNAILTIFRNKKILEPPKRQLIIFLRTLRG